MNLTQQSIEETYVSALREYLASPREHVLERAYELGRQALSGGLGVLAMASVHADALQAVLRAGEPEQGVDQVTARAAAFFNEALAPFEIAHRGYREAYEELRELNVQLEQRAAELAAANEVQKRAYERAAFMEDASRRLSGSLDYEATLQAAARLPVERLAESCVVDVVGEQGGVHDVAGARRDPAGGPPRVERRDGHAAGDAGCLQALPEGGEARPPNGDGRGWHFVVPLVARGRKLGVLALTGAGGEPPAAEEVDLAHEYARRAAVTIDNAQLYRASQEAIRARDDFITAASHELNTPLTPLALLLQAGERRLRRGEAVDGHLFERGLKQVRRLTSLVNDMLDASRLQASPLDVTLAPLRLDELVRELAATLQLASPAHHFQVRTPERPVVVAGDRVRLEQVVATLVGNAVKFSPRGGPVDITVEVRGAEARLAVTDRGVGIPEEERPRLFERFFHARNVPVRRYAGLGLGLYIAREIVVRHAGRIWAESAVGRGSTFYVALPLAAQTEAR